MFSFVIFGSIDPEDAPKQAFEFVRVAVEIAKYLLQFCQHVSCSHPSENVCVHVGDAILFQRDHSAGVEAGLLWANLCVEGETLAIVAVLPLLGQSSGAASLRFTEDLFSIRADFIRDVIVWCKHVDGQANTFLPRQLRKRKRAFDLASMRLRFELQTFSHTVHV